jgi:hypothetical protein
MALVDSASNSNEYQEYFVGAKPAGVYGWQPYHLYAPTVMKSGILNLRDTSGLYKDCFTFYCVI